ncbi:chemotaxis protein CheW [Actinoplanes sp. TFC3]|uniref:chemotaxis protein CheW n=1 Tax=Actinoplanes sp. TFC3 TaxID=1710355 RepID=UPI000829F995|nr:chemotaxis protein CheW [Actinoplanes sp. TFC3]
MTSVEALYGVFHTGRVRVALPLDELREVILRPPAFDPLPVTAEGLLGAVNLRHVVIPVLDLCRLAGYPELDEETGRVIVIVAVGDQMFGLLAQQIEGVARITDEALMETLVAGERSALFSHTFERPEDGAVVSLLDAEAISRIPGVPVVRDTGSRTSGVELGDINTDSTRRTVLLLRCGPIGLCIDVGHVHSVIPQMTLNPSPLDGDTCRGVVHLHGRAVPAVDPLKMLGLGSVPDDGNLRGLVLAVPRGLVVLTVSDIADIATVPVNDVLPLPPVGMRKDGFLTGVLRTEAGAQHLLLDGAALRADAELDALGSLGVSASGQEDEPARAAVVTKAGADKDVPDGRRVVPSVRKFLTYSVGMEAATPLSQITEILPYPQHAIGLDSGGPLQGIFTHRKLSVPLLSLPALLGIADAPDPATARVLLVDAPGGELVGFVVPALHAIEDSVWEESPQKESADPGALLQRGPLVKIGAEAQGRLLPNIDLTELVVAELVG